MREMKGKNCLVLGGGFGQMALIQRLKNRGINVVLQDRNPDCPARSLADIFIKADTVDSESAARAAVLHKVDAVITAGTDQPVLAAARAAASRGCPSLLSKDCAAAVTDKEIMKSRLKAAGIKMPRFRFAGPGAEAEVLSGLRAPYVLKPVDSQGQRGVVLIRNADEFLRYRDSSMKWSRRKRLIVEEYHPNREITVSGWVHKGRVSIWAVTDRVTRDFMPHIGLCLAHRYPSVYAAGLEEEVHTVTSRCTAALGIENGPIYFQCLITESGLLVNETAARLGGAYEDISLPPVCGTDLNEILIAGSFNGSAPAIDKRYTVPILASSFAVPLLFCRPGLVASRGEKLRVMGFPGVTAFDYLLEKGTSVVQTENSVQRAAYLVVHGSSSVDVGRIVKKVWPRIGIWDSEGRQLIRNTIGYALSPQ